MQSLSTPRSYVFALDVNPQPWYGTDATYSHQPVNLTCPRSQTLLIRTRLWISHAATAQTLRIRGGHVRTPGSTRRYAIAAQRPASPIVRSESSEEGIRPAAVRFDRYGLRELGEVSRFGVPRPQVSGQAVGDACPRPPSRTQWPRTRCPRPDGPRNLAPACFEGQRAHPVLPRCVRCSSIPDPRGRAERLRDSVRDRAAAQVGHLTHQRQQPSARRSATSCPTW